METRRLTKLEKKEEKLKKLGSKTKLSRKKKRVLFSLLLSICINQTLYMNVASLLPNLVKDKYCFTETQTGLMLSMFQMSYLVFTPVVSMSLKKIGRKNAVVIGYFLEILSTVGFGSLTLIPPS